MHVVGADGIVPWVRTEPPINQPMSLRVSTVQTCPGQSAQHLKKPAWYEISISPCVSATFAPATHHCDYTAGVFTEEHTAPFTRHLLPPRKKFTSN